MAKLIEQDGFTLRLTPLDHDDEPARERQFVRLALVRRVTFLGRSFNVRESRAQAHATADAVPRALGDGRLLAWRWQGLRDARALLQHRIESLTGLGYEIVERSQGTRGEWDWLRELVRQRLRPSAGDVAAHPRSGVEALRDALTRLGLSEEEVLPGVAELLGLPMQRVLQPTPAAVAACEASQLSILIPFFLEHPTPALREIGQRWWSIPSTAYEIEPWILREWASEDGPMAKALVSRLDREGLALLNVDGLAALTTARRRDVRDAARRWLTRIERTDARAPSPTEPHRSPNRRG